jgi:uncharacterized membrane protein
MVGRAAAAVTAWAVSRGVVVVAATSSLSRGTLFNDPNLLWAWANGSTFGGESAPELAEYPGLARLLALSARLTGGPETFGWAWIAAMLIVDLLVLLVLWRDRPAAGWFWVLAGATLGPVMWLRYDLLVALLALIGLSQRERRPGWAGVALGVAVLLKLWPLVLVPALLLRGDWRRWLAAASATLAAGLAVEALLRGPASLLTPVSWQRDRGVQIESLWATGPLIARRGEDPSTVWEFAYRAFQLQGSGSAVPTVVALLVMSAAALAVLTTTSRVDAVGLAQTRATGAALLTVLVVATNTVFSPQYLMWVLPLVGLVVARSRAGSVVLAGTSLVVAALTQVIWPWGYESLLALDTGVLAVLTVRNGLVIVLAGLLVWRLVGLWGQTRQIGQPGTNDIRT